MFFDHGNQGGALAGLLLHFAGASAPVVWIAFALGWLLTAWPDLAPLFDRHSWRVRFRSEDWRYRLSISFVYDWKVYLRYHDPDPADVPYVTLNPFFFLHRIVDLPAHGPRAKKDRNYQVAVYVLTSLLGLLMLGAFIYLRVVS